MSIQVQLLQCKLSLLSIPLEAYPYFSHGALQLFHGLWKDSKDPDTSSNTTTTASKRISTGPDNSRLSEVDLNISELDLHSFVNISFTPFECSVICPTKLVQRLFGKQLKLLGDSLGVQVLDGEFRVLQIDGDGSDTGSRILEITAPLSAHGIPIFFIPGYSSDFVLIPDNAESRVKKALQSKGFEFSNLSDSYVSSGTSETANSPLLDSPALAALSEETFAKFRKLGVSPQMDVNQKLVLSGTRSFSVHDDEIIGLHVTKLLLGPPKYFAVTLADEEMCFLLESSALQDFPDTVLQGCQTDYVIPIAFDLRKLPQDSTGIASGIASLLMKNSSDLHMSYLSTALSGVVIVNEEDIDVAKEAIASVQ